jgi:hypothetical protein
MNFLAPWAFWFATILPVIVLLYLLKLKRREVPVSTLLFWQLVLRESRRRALFQRLRQWLSLLLHLLIFLLILLALAKPELGRFAKTGASTVLIIDSRARMQAVEKDGASRFANAKKMLAAFTSRASDQNQTALIAAHAVPEVVVPFSGNEKALQQAVAALEPTDADGDLETAIRLADEILASRTGEKRIVVFTAESQSKIQNLKSKIEFVPVGSSQSNVAITRFATRPLPNSPETSQVLLEIRNFSDRPASGNVEIYFDGNLIDVKPFELVANGRKLDIFPSVPRTSASSRGWLTARLDTADALAADNEAFAVLPTREATRVLLVTRGNWFLEKMLGAHDLLKFDLLAPEAFQPAMAKNFDAVILDDFLPDGFDFQKAEGTFLFVKKTPFAGDAKPIDQPLVTDVDDTSPLLRLVNLKNVTFLRGTDVTLPQTSGDWRFQAPLRSFEHPLVVTGSRKTGGAEQRMAAFAFDIADSDLPLRVAFPLLMSNTLEWLAGEKIDTKSNFRAGEVVELLPTQSLWTKPQRTFSPLEKIPADQMAHGSFRQLKNGFYLVQNGDKSEWIAVNTFSEAESNLQQPPSEKSEQTETLHPSSLILHPFWKYLALAAFALFTLEWWLYHRRRTE